MKHILIVFIALTFLNSCKQQELKTIKKYKVKKEKLALEETQSLTETYLEFELKHNQIFQQDLKINSKEYYDNLIDTFIDEETGFFKLFGELWNKPFKSENEIKLLWKLKIERYFRTTAFLNHIRNEITIYADGVNNQRNNGIAKILGIKYSSNLKLLIADANSFNTKSESIEKIISKINDETTDQLADTVLGFSAEIILGILGILGGFKFHWSVPIIVTVLFGVIFFWRSHNRQNEIREILKKECNKALKSNNISYLDQLNKNTINYYSQLKKLNNDANK